MGTRLRTERVGTGAWGRERGDGSVGTGDGSVGTGAWGRERGDGSLGTGAWGRERGDGSVGTERGDGQKLFSCYNTSVCEYSNNFSHDLFQNYFFII